MVGGGGSENDSVESDFRDKTDVNKTDYLYIVWNNSTRVYIFEMIV